MKDKYKAVWLSHSSIGDYLKCPRLYFLHNVYKNPKTRRKITISKPPLSLGQAVHEVVESLSVLPVDERLEIPLEKRFQAAWAKVSGKIGGFRTKEEEEEYRQRGLKMLRRVEENPGPILRKAIKIKSEDGLPWYWFSEEHNLILCGKVDWLEYLEETDSIHLLDFKTGKSDESPDSLQLLIYRLLVHNCQKRKTTHASYWYLSRDNEPQEVDLPTLEGAYEKVLDIGKKISFARQEGVFTCSKGGCRACLPFESILEGKAEFVGVGGYNQEIFIVD